MIAILMSEALLFAAPPPLDAGTDAPTASDFDALTPLAQADLGRARAGQGETYAAFSQQTLTALNAGNSINADSVTSGGVNLDSGAFSGFSGLGNFVINTGNNNNLQGSLSVTILMTPTASK